MNYFWNQSPFVKILIPFCVGIVVYLFFPVHGFTPIISIGIVCLAFIFCWQFFSDFFRHKNNYIVSIVLGLFIGTVGYGLSFLKDIRHHAQWYKHIVGYEYALVRINSPLEEKAKTWKATVDMNRVVKQDSCYETQGEAIVYFKKSDKAHLLHEGNFIWIKNKYKPIENNSVFGNFDYVTYCQRKNIFETAYVNDNDYLLTTMHTNTLTTYFNKGNEWVRGILNTYIFDTNAKGIAEAILIGYRKNVDKETWKTYSNTGIVHVIAISGMHMGMIYISVVWLLHRIPFLKRNKKYPALLAIIFMWLFACLTGLPPSVTRAAIMFSFLGIGEIANKKMYVYNSVSASAFCLLCYNPNWLFDVGFQLSYSALLSMLLFYEKIYHCYSVKNWLGNKTWQLIAGTISAQVLTMPIIVYYFHQFPLLFLVSNMIAIPATALILYAEIVLLFFSFIKPLSVLLGKGISLLIIFLNAVVEKLSSATWAVMQTSHINVFQTLLLLTGILILTYAFQYRNTKWLIASLSICVLFGLSVLWLKISG